MPVLLDFESRSRADLKCIGGRNYWAHASTEAICAVLYHTDTREVGLWVPGMPCPVTRDTALGAHNARGFDRFAAAKYGWPDITVDTSELARRAGLPGALDALALRWLGRGKDKEGSRFTLSLSRPSRAKARLGQLPELTPEVMARVVAYCANDVEVLADGWPRLESWLDVPWENDVSRVERIVNDRGIAFDTQLARRLIEVCEANADGALEHAARELGDGMGADALRDIVMSPEQFTAFTGLENAQSETIDTVLGWGTDALADGGRQYWACYARRAIASIARGKLEAGLSRVSPDGRLRDMHRYYGGHTGRWSGQGIQLQNLPRPAKRFESWGDGEICAAADAVLAGMTCDAETVDVLLRACLTGDGAPLAVCDFSGVESRATAWCADDGAALDVFASGKDPYKVMAATIFGCAYEDIGKDERRQVGKIAELACGYGMGAPKFDATAAKAGSNLSKLGVDPAVVVDAWRRQHWPIVRLWRALEDAFLAAVRGDEASVSWSSGAFTFTPSHDGRDVAAFLPSGRPVVYNEVRESPGMYTRPELSYQGTKFREHLYGGKLCENLIQAFCRDLMADALVRAEDAGLEPVLHVHDEIVSRAGNLDALHGVMTTLPQWAEGFPIGAAGHEGLRYRK
jgi:DNA polymerase